MFVKAQKQLGHVVHVNLVAVLELLGNYIRGSGHLEDTVSHFLVFAAQVLESTLKEHAHIDRLEALFVGIFLQPVGIYEIYCTMGNSILLVLNLLAEEIPHCLIVLADEPIKFRGTAVKDRGDNVVQ